MAERLPRAVTLAIDTVERAVALPLTDGVTETRGEREASPEGLLWDEADTDDVAHPLGVAVSEEGSENEATAVCEPKLLSVALAESVASTLLVGLVDIENVAEGLTNTERLNRLDTLRRALAEKLLDTDGDGDADEERDDEGEREVVDDTVGERLVAGDREVEGEVLVEPEARGDREPLADVEGLLEDDTDALTVAVALGVADTVLDVEVLPVEE